MAREVTRGEIWTYRFAPPDKRRPVLVLSRNEAIRVLRTVMVAPITSVIRGLVSEVVVGTDEGLAKPSAVNLDHVQTVRQDRLVRYLGHLPPSKMRSVCSALAVAVGCDS
jgi:mRNA interferase MazF